MVQAVELNDVLKDLDLDLDLSRADGRAGLGTLLREIQERLNAGAGYRPAAARQGGDTTVYNAAPAAGLDDVGVACGV